MDLHQLEDLFLQVFNAYVVAAFMDWTGMMQIQSPPTKVSAPPDVMRNQQEKTQYLNSVIGSFVDNFCLALPNVKKAIEKQREQQQQACVQNNNNDNDSVQSESNSISPGMIYLFLDTHVASPSKVKPLSLLPLRRNKMDPVTENSPYIIFDKKVINYTGIPDIHEIIKLFIS